MERQKKNINIRIKEWNDGIKRKDVDKENMEKWRPKKEKKVMNGRKDGKFIEIEEKEGKWGRKMQKDGIKG